MKLAGPPCAPVPEAFQGVWRRTLLEGPGIATDTGSQVFWLQTRQWHGDLRLPAGRPAFDTCRKLGDCSPVQREWLAGQRGFAGITQIERPSAAPVATTYCQWHRRVDFQPPTGQRDIGTLVASAEGWVLEEFGVDADYHETWVRLPDSIGRPAAWERRADPAEAPELLLVTGAFFMFVRPRRLVFPDGGAVAPLAALIAASGDTGWLDMEISFGGWDPATRSGVITHSTLPWREGAALAWTTAWVAAATDDPDGA